MSDTVISVENISKQYRLGEVGTGTLRHDFNRWWHKARGKEDPYLKIGEANDRTVKGGSDYVWALKDVSFEVKRGEVLGIIGKNGAGKSTLLKILSRVTTPTSGEIKVKGRIASLLEVGTGFNPDLTGRDNIYLNGAILGMRKREIDRKFDEIVAFAEVERYIDTPVKRYSSGMYVRLAFAVAAHLEPEILVVDEVLAVGDAAFQKKCLGKMHDVSAKEGRTILFVSHHMATVTKLCTRGLLLINGQISSEGKTNEVVQAYFASTQTPSERNKRLSGITAKPASIADAWLEDNEQRVERFVFGASNARVVLVMEITSDITLGVELVLRDAQQHPIAFGASGLAADTDYRLAPGRYTVFCDLPPLTLAQGDYAFDLILAISGEKLLDHIESALPFSIEPTAVGKRNWNFPQSIGRGSVLCNVRFSEPYPRDKPSL